MRKGGPTASRSVLAPCLRATLGRRPAHLPRSKQQSRTGDHALQPESAWMARSMFDLHGYDCLEKSGAPRQGRHHGHGVLLVMVEPQPPCDRPAQSSAARGQRHRPGT